MRKIVVALLFLFLSFSFATDYDYWVDSLTNYSFVETDLSNSSNTTFYIYYEGSTNKSDGDAVFDFFDDFEDESFNSSKWYEFCSAGSYTESGGRLNVSGGAGWECLGAKNQYSTEGIFELYAEGSSDACNGGNSWAFGSDERSDDGVMNGGVDLAEFYCGATDKYLTRKDGVESSVAATFGLTSLTRLTVEWTQDFARFYEDGVSVANITTNIPADDQGVVLQGQGGLTASAEWALHREYTDASINCSYGAVNSTGWTINGESYSKRREVTCESNETISDYQWEFDYNYFNDSNMLVTTGDGSTGLSINATLQSDVYETENNTMSITLTPSGGNLTAYWVVYTYNNTEMLRSNDTGVNLLNKTFTVSTITPLVASNNTNISWTVDANVTIGGSNYTDSEAGNQTVKLWYYINTYNITKNADYTIEEENNFTVAIPSRPSGADNDVTHNYSYVLTNCTKEHANTTTYDIACNDSLFSITNISYFELEPSHLYEDGIIYADYYLNRSYNVSFSATAESISEKTISQNDTSLSTEYFVWLVNSSNGTIDGASNLSDVFNATFYDEITLNQVNVSSATSTYHAYLPDGETKNYSVYYSGTNAVEESLVRGYPDFYSDANLTSVEVYTKENYTTRSRFLRHATVDFGVLTNVSVYLLPDSDASLVLITVLDNGEEVNGAYVQILKYYAVEGLYLNIEQKTTDSNGQCTAYLNVDAYYKFIVTNADGDNLYVSSAPEQVTCSTEGCTKVINLDQEDVNLITPYKTATCYGNASTNTIVFSYADYTGLTSSVNYLAWRANQTTPVCNQTISGSSSAYNCVLSAPENLTIYLYICEVRYEASPWWTAFIDWIDLRTFTGMQDWVVVAIVFVVGLAGAFFHPAVGLAGVGLSLYALNLLNILELNEASVISIVIVAGILTYLFLKEDR